MPRIDPDKRYRGADDDLDDEGLSVGADDGYGLRLDEKRKTEVTTAIKVSEAGESKRRAHRKPALKAHTSVNTKSRAVGYKADMPMTPSAHGGGDQCLHVPSVQQEPTAMTTREELPLLEGSMQGATSGQSDTMVQQEGAEVYSIELKATKNNLSKRHKEVYKLFLDATSEDFERGTLHVYKCKLCHGANFTTWDHFMRHCKSAESHPLRLLFCDQCGDFFARGDSLKRHSVNRPPECHDISQQEAEAKRNETKSIHREFLNNTKAYLETNQGTWTPFAQIVKKYPNSSKRLKR